MNFLVFSLGGNDPLARSISEKLGVSLGQIKCKTFADGEQQVQFLENLRGKHVYLIQPTNPPSDNWLRLLLAIDAARGASAQEITAVVPYFGYARQDRKARPREPISARVFATMLDALGTDRLLTMDLHNDAIGGFFRSTLVDYLYARPVLISFFREFFADALAKDDLVVVSPDAGGVVRAQSYAKRLMKAADLAIIHKERDIPNQVARMKLIGDVSGKIALILDDMADTCGTLARAAALLAENGAREVYAAATHGILSGEASKAVDDSPIQKLFITDSISPERRFSGKVQVVSVAPLFADAIRRIETGESLSALFETD
ncbi:MAG TPA: ribose-phosphate diphosphokinase [Candidatus Paceibacterota bacterium]|jgi:ribose-phosphate pyrophosphokinase|nr:ribose-phosphate diphosphokinase [Candidatus Paceibacterota bacterium]